jgi:endonuclease III
VNLVVHGQRTCVPRTPRCEKCVLRQTCMTGRRHPNG